MAFQSGSSSKSEQTGGVARSGEQFQADFCVKKMRFGPSLNTIAVCRREWFAIPNGSVAAVHRVHMRPLLVRLPSHGHSISSYSSPPPWPHATIQ
ncbi:hypothetical protein RISK_002863 [Rhodopirellula islandica]|uniref:Uncharacterized protein n=1 Tax=Rhodopirellula islandica TaxID=595434 RepID=A0A0J1BF19_RHOIS|nr:hypothetical protein RISK_002863 [Rhodopirellula islandica]